MFLLTAFPLPWMREANVRQLRLTIKHRHICIFTEETLTLEARTIVRQFKKIVVRTICIFWSQAAQACIATGVCMQQASAVRQTATRTGITLICMGTVCAFTLAQARKIQSGTEKFVRLAARTAPVSAAAGTEQGK